MRRILLPFIVAIASAAALVPAAFPIVNGTPDGNAHPYVGIAVSGDWFCSGTLISPTVFVTAGHCTAGFAATGKPTFVTFDPNASGDSVYVRGTPHTMAGFFDVPPKGVGLPGSVGNDLGVVVLDEPVALASYGQLPSIGFLGAPASRSATYTLVGYGAQDWVSGQGGRFPIFTFERTRASSRLVNVANAYGDEFARFSTSQGDGRGGIGPGDSGGPALVGDGPTVAAVGSHGPSLFADGEVYFTRLDTENALAFIRQFL
jgi:hypothetical protein